MLLLTITLISGMVFITVSIVWYTYRVGISPMPSSPKACRTMLVVIAEGNSGKGPIIDLGAGWGHLAYSVARRFPDRQVIGYELSIVPWCVSVAIKHIFDLRNLTMYRREFLGADLSEASVLLCYLFPGGMQSLREKLVREESSIGLIISNTFALPQTEPDKVILLNDIYRTPIYVYQNYSSSAFIPATEIQSFRRQNHD